jgi:hypothetical protein
VIALKKKTKATQSSNHLTASLVAHTAEVVASVLRSRLGKKMEDVLRKDQFGFRRGRGISDAVGMLGTLSEQTSDIDGELCACFIDWQKGYDRVNWTKLVLILKRNGIDLRERRYVKNLYMDQIVRVQLEQGETRSVNNLKS